MTTQKTKKMLCYMDFNCPTGFGTVAHNVLDRLTPFFKQNNIEVDVCALNYGDNPHKQYNEQIMVLNPKEFAKNKSDFYYRDGLLKILQIGEYDLLWIMNDVPVISPMGEHFKYINKNLINNKRKPFKTLFYTPIDSKPNPKYFKNFDWFNSLVTYTEYAKKEIIEACKINDEKNKFDISIIAHGINLEHFKVLNKKNQLREKYNLPKDVFLWGNINKNQPRKDIGGTLISFMFFKKYLEKNHPEKKTSLYLHCYHSDPTGINLFHAIERLGLKLNVDVFLPIDEKYKNNEYSPREINELYNCLDGFVNTTMAEGFGLTILEAMGVGLPVVVGLHTSINEITNNGELVYGVTDFIEHIQIQDSENIRYKLNPQAVCLQMIQAFNDSDKNINYLKKYTSKINEYNWDVISNEFKKQIKKLIL